MLASCAIPFFTLLSIIASDCHTNSSSPLFTLYPDFSLVIVYQPIFISSHSFLRFLAAFSMVISRLARFIDDVSVREPVGGSVLTHGSTHLRRPAYHSSMRIRTSSLLNFHSLARIRHFCITPSVLCAFERAFACS